MTISVVIPAYNCADTIEDTLESVFRQTSAPFEILVLDDGSTDGTPAALDRHKGRVSIFRQPNRGVGPALNVLCEKAQGDVLAVLGSDDIWHPSYLATQIGVMREQPGGVAYFTGHINFTGSGGYRWASDHPLPLVTPKLFPSADFIRQYNKAAGPFTCMSYCCVDMRALKMLGREPFPLRIAEDFYFLNRLAALDFGPIIYLSSPLVAYRVRAGSLSSNRLLVTESEVRALELLEEDLTKINNSTFSAEFRRAFAAKRRVYAKALMGAGRRAEARNQFRESLALFNNPTSQAKSLGLLLSTYLPEMLQPHWPQPGRDPRFDGRRSQ